MSDTDDLKVTAKVNYGLYRSATEDLDAAEARITELHQALAERDATIAAARTVASGMADDPEYPLELLWRTRIMESLSAAPGDALRAHDAETTPVVQVHHFDIEKHAESFNEGYEAAITQGLADDPALAQDWLAAHDAEVQAKALEDARRNPPAHFDHWMRMAYSEALIGRAKAIREQEGE